MIRKNFKKLKILFMVMIMLGFANLPDANVEAQEWLDVPGQDIRIKAGHPRLYLTPENIDEMRNRCADTDLKFDSCKGDLTY